MSGLVRIVGWYKDQFVLEDIEFKHNVLENRIGKYVCRKNGDCFEYAYICHNAIKPGDREMLELSNAIYTQNKEKNMFEVLDARHPVRFYLDVSINDDDRRNHKSILKLVVQSMEHFTSNHPDFRKVVITQMSNDDNDGNSQYFRLIYPDTLFKNNHVELKRFVVAFVNWYTKKHSPRNILFKIGFVYFENMSVTIPPLCYVDEFLGDRDDDWMIQPINYYEPRLDTDSRNDQYKKIVSFWPAINNQKLKPLPEGVITLRSDSDFLKYLDADELRIGENCHLFYPCVMSLAKTVEKDKLLEWCGSNYGGAIEFSKKFHQHNWVSCDEPLNILKQKVGKHSKIIDLRENVTKYSLLNTVTIEPTTTDDWIGVEANEFSEKMISICRNRQEKEKICNFITGKLPTNKSKCVLDSIEKQLRYGHVSSVLYIYPRIESIKSLIEEIQAMYVEGLQSENETDLVKKFIMFYNGNDIVPKTPNQIQLERLISEQKKNILEQVHFICCDINSIEKLTHDAFDLVVIAEPRVTIGNLSNNYESSGGQPQQGTNLNIFKHLKRVTASAKILHFVEAAFNRNVIKFCEHYCEDNKFETKQTLKFAVYNYQNTQIFTHVEEYYNEEALTKIMLDCYKNGYKTIVYCSNLTLANEKFSLVLKNSDDHNKVEDISLLTDEPLWVERSLGEEKNMPRFVIVTPGLGVGSSITYTNEVQRVILFLEYTDRCPRTDDIVQLCAKFRNNTSQKLMYTVSSNTLNPISPRVYRKHERKGEEDLFSKIVKYFNDEESRHRAQCSFPKVAQETTKDVMMNLFSTTRDKDLIYTRPEYKLITTCTICQKCPKKNYCDETMDEICSSPKKIKRY